MAVGDYRMRAALMFAALLAVIAASPAPAAELTLTKSADPASYQPTGRAVDVLGIAPGMTPDAVHAILEKRYGDATTQQDNMGLQFRGVVVATQPYVTKISARKDGDDITVWFATPATGNGVVEVSRQTTFFNPADAVDIDQARAELIAKYGPPAFDGLAVRTGEVRLVAWTYNGDKASPCPQSSCRAYLSEGLSVGDMANYRRAVRSGHDLTIVATLLASIANPKKATSVVVVVSDVATKLRTLEAALSQMTAAAGPPPGRSRSGSD